MAGELITIEKGGKTARCEGFQLPAMQAKGWRVVPPQPTVAREDAFDVVPDARLFEVAKGDKKGWCDEKTFKRLKAQGWERSGQDAEEAAGAAGGEADQENLALILGALDPADDELWNADGALKMGAFNEAFDLKETRASVQAAWPDFSREALASDRDDE